MGSSNPVGIDIPSVEDGDDFNDEDEGDDGGHPVNEDTGSETTQALPSKSKRTHHQQPTNSQRPALSNNPRLVLAQSVQTMTSALETYTKASLQSVENGLSEIKSDVKAMLQLLQKKD